jgi:hypothetical protein
LWVLNSENHSQQQHVVKAFSLSVSKSRLYTDAFPSSVLLASALDGELQPSTKAPTRKKPLSPKEILEQQRAMQGTSGDDEDSYPKLFDDNLLQSMQKMLLTLEKRVKNGPASLNILEVEDFISMSQMVAKEMKEKEYQRLQDATTDTHEASGEAALEVTTVSTTATVTESTAVGVDGNIEIQKSSSVTEWKSSEDGPAYDPSGGQGSLAKGTRNTYVIPNMDEMSPEEYQKALQQSLYEQQIERRKKMQAGYGNRASWDYLNNLTGESGVLKDSAFED